MAVSNISTSKKNTIIAKSVNPLPNNPSRVGYSASDIKGAMFKFVTDDSDSVIAEINRIVNEVNAEFEDYTKTESLGELATKDTVDYETEVTNKPDIPAKTSDLTNDGDGDSPFATEDYVDENGGKIDAIQKNGTTLQITNKTVNITVPVDADDVGALPDTTKYGATIDLSMDTSTYVVTVTLKDQDGTALSTKTLDLPLESLIVSGRYDSATKKVIFTLKDGSTIEFSVADLVSGLQSEITSSNKLSADLVDDDNTTNKFVTSTDINNWNKNIYWCSSSTTYAQVTQALTDGKMPVYKSGNFLFYYAGTNAPTNTIYYFVRHNATTLYEIQLSSSGWSVVSSRVTVPQERTIAGVNLQDNITKAELLTALNVADGAEANVQSDWDETDTTADDYIKNKPTIPTVNDGTLTIQKNGTTINTFTANSATNTTINVTVPTNNNELINGAGYVTSSYHDSTKQDVISDLTTIRSNASAGKTASDTIATYGDVVTKNVGTSSGNVVVVGSDGKVASSIIPASAITETFVVASQSAMLALTAQVGDVAVRTDLNKSFILKATPASTLANWQELLTPTDAVQSVNGQTGAVQLGASDVGAVASNTAITGATKCKITYDSKGLVTGGADLTSADVVSALGFTPYDASNPSEYRTSTQVSEQISSAINNLGDLAFEDSIDYTSNKLTNKPTIPTVNNSTITLTQGGVTKGSFTTNQSGNATIDFDAGQAYELYSSYNFPIGSSSVRFQICELGEFDDYEYTFVMDTPTISANTSLFMELGNSSSSLNSGGASTKYGIENNSNSSGSRTPMGYYVTSSYEFNYCYNRASNISIKFSTISGNGTYLNYLGQSTQGLDGSNYNFSGVRFFSSLTDKSNVTHLILYVGSGTFSGVIGSLQVYRRKK